MATTKTVEILGAGIDLGAARRGVDMGPSALRYSDIEGRLTGMGFEVIDRGNLEVEIAELAPVSDVTARYLPEILQTCSELAAAVQDMASKGHMPLILGGDHSIAIGTLSGLSTHYGAGGVLWVDAHGDLNSPGSSPSGNVHGMPLAAALGTCGFDVDGTGAAPWVDPARVAIVGVRQLDPGEKEVIKQHGLAVFTMHEIDRRGVAAVMREAIDIVRGPGFVHLSLDVDACDPEIAPGVGTPVRGGFSYREAHLAMEILAEADVLTSLEVVELNPILDHADITGRLAVELVESALGARIL